MLYAFLPVGKGVEERPTDTNSRRAQGERLKDVRAARDPPVEVDFKFSGCKDGWTNAMDIEKG